MKKEIVFIVDDMPDILDLVKSRFSSHGFENVVAFESPDDVINEINRGNIPKVIFSDYNMPEMKGPELLDKIISKHPKTVGLIMTADVSRASAHGATYPIYSKEMILQFPDIVKNHIEAANDKSNILVS
jgi:DNA-binding NtrC family response regulator